MDKRMRVFVGLGAFLIAVCFMLFGPSDMGENPSVTGLILGGILGFAVLVGRLIMRRRKQPPDPEHDTNKKE